MAYNDKDSLHGNLPGDVIFGIPGKSAYELAVENGYEGTILEWLESQKGKSAYGYAVDAGYSGTEEDFARDMAKVATKGESSFSVAARVVQTTSGAKILITDKDGSTEATISNGKDGEDGYTPQKGVDYFDGKDGSPGADGYTPVKGKDYFDGENGSPGKDGTDGVSATHSWNGTVLTITSASGTSSTDLKGEPGKDGSSGKDGNGIKSAVLNADCTLTLTFDDGTSYTTTSIRGAVGATGSDGKDGSDGVGIASIKQTTTSSADDGNNVFTVALTNGTSSTFTVKNGSKGSDGAAGNDGTSVTVKSVSESTTDGGSNVVTFSDGKTVTIKNGKTGAAGKDGSDGLPGSPGSDGADGYTPVKGVDYYTDEEKADWEAYIAAELAKRGQLAPVFANSIEECTDTTKLYVLPDGYIYAYMLTEIESGPAYTNVLPLAINADGTPYVGTNGEKGYKTGYRLNSSRLEKEATDRCCTGFIPVKYTDEIRFKNILAPTDSNINGYIHFYGSDFSTNTGLLYELADTWEKVVIPSQAKTISSASTNATDQTAYMRISAGVIDDTSIITINEEIVEGGGTTTGYAWANTGHAFVPADYEDRIVELEALTEEHSTDIANLKKGVANVTAIKDWDAPIYDANIPVFELSAEKAAMTNATNTPDAIYAMYDALMAKHPRYITRTDLGLCSDGVNHVYRYDFREPEPHYESGKVWSETKTKAILMTGVHFEWAGIYSLYYALEEIADNPELRNFRRNTHLIVIPVANPYATIANNYQSGLSTPNSYGVRNANGVEIHRNFEVDWVLTEEGSTHYGGAEPLSEVETRYIDRIMKDNQDAALFLSAHNCGADTFWGTGFVWASTATRYMCNMGYRVIDKLSDAWMDKYGDTLSAGIAEYKTDLLEDDDSRLGWTGLSSSPGTEAKQATKYGIQGTNVEICDPFQIHGTKANPEPSMSAFTMSRGAEVYVNFLLTTFGVYDPKDKSLYG